jgi:hypothetical protein
MGTDGEASRNLSVAMSVANSGSIKENRMKKDGNTAWAMIAGAACGGVLMYLADPNRGSSRRASVRQQMAHRVREFGCVADKGVRDLRNRAQGILAEAWSSIKTGSVSDEVLVDRVRAKIGRAVSHPGEI